METVISLDTIGALNPDNLELSFTYGTQGQHSVKYYDDGFGPLFLHLESCGNFMCISGIVRAGTWHDAMEVTRDEFCQRVEQSEVYEAYGYNSQEEMDSATDKDSRDLVERYDYQSNSTGIVHVDYNERLEPLTVELMGRWGITMHVKMEGK